MNNKQIVLDAIKLLEKKQWCRNASFMKGFKKVTNQDDFDACCALGAIVYCAKGLPTEILLACDKVVTSKNCGYKQLSNYNDHVARNKEEMISIMYEIANEL